MPSPSLDISDLRATIVPKSDQLNADQLVGGTLDITITDVRIGSSDEQPISIHYENENGRPYKPCKTMRKVILFAWGIDGREWVGKSMRLYHDPRVKWAGAEVGGIRISHLSDIAGTIKVSLAATKSAKALHTIEPLIIDAGPTLAEVLAAIEGAHNKTTLDAAKALAQRLRSQDDIEAAQAAYRARVAALKAAASATPNPTTTPEP